MADKKISQLTGASTPLAGTEVLPIVQSSTTVKVATDDLTVKNVRSNATSGILQIAGPAAASTRVMTTPDANFTAARTDAANSFTGDQTLATGNLVVGTAGKGIDFSAVTNGPGVTITEVLPSYVAGYYTTTMAASTSGTVTLAFNTLAYVKVGRMVTVTGEITVDSVASPVGDISFVLPFTAGPSTAGRMGNADFIVRAYSFAGGLTGSIYGSIVQNSTTCNLVKIEDFVTAGIAANLQAGTTFVFCFSYIAAS